VEGLKSLPETLFRKGVSSARLEVPLKFDRALLILKTEMKHYLPGTIFGCMRRPAGIMGSKPLIKVGGNAYIALIWNCKTLDEVDEFHEPSPFAKASGDSLRLKAGLPAEALAKAVEGRRFYRR